VSKEVAQHIYDEIRSYMYLCSAVKETTYSWVLEGRRDLIDSANEIVDLFEEEIQRRGEQLDDILERNGLTICDLRSDEYFDPLA